MSPDTRPLDRTAARRFTAPEFRPRAPWFGGDLQTVRAYLLGRPADLDAWPAERLLLPMADGSGDRLAAALHRPQTGGTMPLVVLLHGLTGCEDSTYIRDSARHLLGLGHSVLRFNLRGAGPARATCRFQYHSGRAEDLRDALQALARREPRLIGAGVFLVGFSLGGNLLIKFLAEHGRHFPILGAVSVSAPIDLKAAQECLMTRRNALYHGYMLARMKREAVAPGAEVSAAERAALESARNVLEFDEVFTAPRNGFDGAADYYRRCSGAQFLPEVGVPTLVIHALDDPWIPGAAYRAFDWDSAPDVTPLLPASGGHVGFHGRGSALRWHDRCMAAFFAALGGKDYVGQGREAVSA